MKNLIELRINNGLTQKQLAQQLNITDKAYWSYERGRTEPDINTLIKIADYFDVSLDYLCGRQNNNLIFADSLSDKKKELFSMIKDLNDDETLIVLGFVARLANKPIDEVMSKLNKKSETTKLSQK